MAQIYKSPAAQADAMAPLTTRQKWEKYMRNGFSGNPRTINKYNKMIEEIESELPFESEEEHKHWGDLGATWTGQPEWPALTEKVLKRGEDYSLEPEQISGLKKQFKGKDYGEAMKRLMGGEAYGDIINGLVRYEK